MNRTLYIAAKAPRAGQAKTRLGHDIGHGFAVELYRAFLRDLGARFSKPLFDVVWYVTPHDAWPEISPLLSADGRELQFLFQEPGDWTERQRELFRAAAARAEERVVLIASDSPQVTVEVVARAFDLLDRHDLILGPTYDGGYYLIGMRGFWDVLRDVPMSTATVLDDITAQAKDAGLSVGWVETTFDIDEAGDLERLRQLAATREDLPATRTALQGIGPGDLNLITANGRPLRGKETERNGENAVYNMPGTDRRVETDRG